jgi:hypothetical protein
MCAVVVVTQLTLLPALRPLGVVPNAVLGLVALVGMEGTASEALAMAVVAGVAVDLGVEMAGAIIETVMVVGGTLLMNLVVLVSLAGTAARWDWSLLMVHLLLQLALNVALMQLLRPAVRWLMRQPNTGAVLG